MNKTLKWLAIILSGLLIGVVMGNSLKQYLIPTNGTIQAIGDFDYYIEGVLTPSSLNWGIMTAGTTYFVELKITSKPTNNAPITITVTADLPVGWTHLWSLNNIVWQIGETKYAGYELTPSATASAGIYSWTTTITATEA